MWGGRKRSAILFSSRKKNRAGCTAFVGEKVVPPSFFSVFPVLSPAHSHPSARERPLMEGCFYEAGGFVLSVLQRSHATVDVPNQPPLLCSASSTIPGTSSSMPMLIQSACRELWDHRVAGTLVYAGGRASSSAVQLTNCFATKTSNPGLWCKKYFTNRDSIFLWVSISMNVMKI